MTTGLVELIVNISVAVVDVNSSVVIEETVFTSVDVSLDVNSVSSVVGSTVLVSVVVKTRSSVVFI